jgi:tetratricopeptide (TPR) repeat protein
MLAENIKNFLKVYVRPLSAMSDIIDNGSWLFGAVAVVAVSAAFLVSVATPIHTGLEAVPVPIERPRRPPAQQHASLREVSNATTGQGPYDDEDGYYDGPMFVTRSMPMPVVGQWFWRFVSFAPFSVLATVLSLAVLYVPATILAAILFERLGSFAVALRRDYGPLLACTFLAWAASHLPFAVAGFALAGATSDPYIFLALWAGATLYFALLMICAVRVVVGTSWATAVATVGVSWVSTLLESFFLLLASPLLLIWVFLLMRGEASELGASYSRRQSFRRSLEAATVNPRDAEAHYQLGLIYQQRRQYSEAITRFRRAVEIDPTELDAHFQLGRIAREQGRLQEAIEHFNAVVSEDEKHSHSEIWREIGATYADAGMYDEALGALETYVERRPYDAQGQFFYGEALSGLGRAAEATDAFDRAVEAARTAPYYRRGEARRWAKKAEERLRARRAAGK